MIEEAQTIDAALDQLLIIWHTWASSEQVGQGYYSESPGTKMYRASRQYDYDNGAIDSDVDTALAAGVDRIVHAMPDPHRTAICVNARNLKTGRAVWRSARLPQDMQETAVILMEARNQLMRRLQAAGLM